MNETTAEHVLTITDGNGGSKSDVWIADLGATSHMTNTLEGMYDIKDVSTQVKWEMENTFAQLKVVSCVESCNKRTEVRPKWS